MNESLTFECDVHFDRCGRGSRKEIHAGEPTPPEPGRVPRISRLMALAIRFDRLIHDGVVANQSQLAELGHVTRARVTQVMNLLNLAPDIQEAILFLPRTLTGRDAIHLRMLQPIAAVPDWRKQRRMWAGGKPVKHADFRDTPVRGQTSTCMISVQSL